MRARPGGWTAALVWSVLLVTAGCTTEHFVQGPSSRPAEAPGRSGTADLGSQGGVADRSWSPGRVDAGRLSGFADRVSVPPGGSVRLYVSTSARTWTATAYRMGWYGGALAGRIRSWPTQQGVRQAPPAEIPATRTPYAPWRPSLTVSTAGWMPGDYLFKLHSASGFDWLVPLTVRSPSAAGRVVIVNAVTTWQAYNTWGGRSLYAGRTGGLAQRAYAVSFDRPYGFGAGAADFLGNELPLVALAERLRLPLAYVTDVDLDVDRTVLAGARALISLGHDEYWSAAMRAQVTAARDAGMNIAFLGANAVYRPIRLSATRLGANRLEIDYKNARLDPIWSSNPRAATAWSWDSLPYPRPQSVLTGALYRCNPVRADMVAVDPDSWLLRGLVAHGQALHGLVGSEYDGVDLAVPTPRPMEVLFHSPVRCGGRPDFADAVYYTARSGAAVFDSGTSSFVCALAAGDCSGGRGDATADAVVRGIMVRLLTAFAAGPAGRPHPAHDNLAQLGLLGR